MKKPLETYKKGDKVKVDMSSSGDGIKFLTINEGFATKNCNGYKEYNFQELDSKIRISEYYIRPLSESDIKLKKLYEEQNVDKFDFNDQEVNRTFWESQKENIVKCKNFIDNFLHPYLIEYKHVIPVDNMVDWNSYYKNGMHLKNDYVFVIPHEYLHIVVFQHTTYVDIMITAPINIDPERNYRGRELHLFTLGVQYSDESVVEHIKNTTKAIIKNFDESLKKGDDKYDKSYFIHPYPEYDNLKTYEHLVLKGNSSDWSTIPTSQYVFVLRKLTYINHNVFNKGFE